ncbi:protein disulfide-isomerase A4 [Haematobia irritans]|uniref:Putative thioredoxin/protein disulfide isomerase n=1 Tax=Haematobia irritans TaxID=7368 RepID=A0A1L8ED50_HAEIR
MNKSRGSLLFLLLLGVICCCVAVIEQVDDGDLIHMLTGREDNVIVLFTKNNCQECDDLELVVENAQKDLKDNVGAVVVKALNSHMVNLYDPTREPALIYFRRGVPLLYHGEKNVEDIVRMFSENSEPAVKELGDDNFEHLTQASTGATTGDWLVFFYSADCVFCLRLHATWEAVAAHLKHRLNVARVNRLEAGISTAKRFGIVESPEFILLRQGKIYRYKPKQYTAQKFIDFATKDYAKQTNPEPVPAEEANINSFISDQLKSLADNQQLILIICGVLAVVILLAVIIACKASKKKAPTVKKPTNKTKKAK